MTFHPTRTLYLQRAVIDGLRILIPGYLALAALVAWSALMYWIAHQVGVAVTVAAAPVAAMSIGVCTVAVVAGLKKAVMGTYKPEIKPLWSLYVWLNEMVNGAYESVVAPVLLPLLGTPFVTPLLRLMGCQIGKHTYIATTLMTEFDLIDIGDYAMLNHGAVIQNHLFEDRVFKSSNLRIGPEASIGNMSVILYDSHMERGAVVGPLSLLMKGETLKEGTHWHGIPTMPASPHQINATSPLRTLPLPVAPSQSRDPILSHSSAAHLSSNGTDITNPAGPLDSTDFPRLSRSSRYRQPTTVAAAMLMLVPLAVLGDTYLPHSGFIHHATPTITHLPPPTTPVLPPAAAVTPPTRPMLARAAAVTPPTRPVLARAAAVTPPTGPVLPPTAVRDRHAARAADPPPVGPGNVPPRDALPGRPGLGERDRLDEDPGHRIRRGPPADMTSPARDLNRGEVGGAGSRSTHGDGAGAGAGSRSTHGDGAGAGAGSRSTHGDGGGTGAGSRSTHGDGGGTGAGSRSTHGDGAGAR